MSLLGIDVGTTGCKAIAFSPDGKVLAQAYREYGLVHPQPGWAELETEGLWRHITTAIREINQQVAADPIRALSVSCQGEAVTAIDERGTPLGNFSVSFDHRTIPQAGWWRTQWGAARLFKITGMPLHAMHTINKIMWYQQHRPELYAKAVKFLCIEDFINHRLTCRYATDWSLAARTMAFDILNKRWSDEVLDAAKVNRSLLPEAYPSGAVVGEVLSDVADDLGFRHGVVVATGGHDQPCGALGAGIAEPGIAMNALGTSDVICPVFDKPLLSDRMLAGNYSCYPHVDARRYVSIAFNLTGGLLLRWYRDTLCQVEASEAAKTGTNVYDIIVNQASSAPKPLFFLPHFVGAGTPWLDSHSRGALVGLTVSTTKADLSKAVLDSTNYELRLNIELMNRAGMGIRGLRAVGGGAKNRHWLQMRADTLGLPVSTMRISEAASLGAAMLAGTSIGLFKDVGQAAAEMVRLNQTYLPDCRQTELYEEPYRRYTELYPTLKEFNTHLGGQS